MTAFYGKISELQDKSIDDIAKELWHSEYDNYDVDTSNSEYQSWLKSLPLLIKAISDAGLGELDLIMEYTTPLGSRVDAMLVGYSKDGQPSVLLIEDKQWSDENVKSSNSRFVVDVRIGKNFEERTHPLYQLRTYDKELTNNHDAFTGKNIDIKQLAFVHNMEKPDTLLTGTYSIWKRSIEQVNSMLIGKNDEHELIRFVDSLFENKNNRELTEQIVNGSYVLGKSGLDGLNKAINSEENTLMVKDQAPVNAFICDEIEKQITNPHKELIVVTGAAGTGKTILGFHAIYDYHQMLKVHGFKTGTEDALYSLARNRTLKIMIDKINGIRIPYVEQIIGNQRVKFLVIDEAHRIGDVNKTLDGLFNSGINIILVLQDDWQTISAEDDGAYDNFEQYANSRNIKIEHKFLNTQLRTGLNSNLTEIIDNIFTDKHVKETPKNFKLVIEDSLQKMEYDMIGLSHKGLTKWVAPFCWRWSRNANHNDVQINDHGYMFSHPWNPSGTMDQYNWLSSNDSINEVASIYTTQGIDLDYAGIIWWDDLKWDASQQKWIFDLNQIQDYRFKKGIEEKYHISSEQANREQNPDILRLFLNTYKVLLSRARKGTLIWFKNKDTEDYVRLFF